MTLVACGFRLTATESGIFDVFMGFVGRDWSWAAEFTNYERSHWGIDNYIQFIFLILLGIGWKVSTRVRMTPVKSFIYQTILSKVIFNTANAPYMSIIEWGSDIKVTLCHWMRRVRFHVKILGASDTKFNCSIQCSWVLSHQYGYTSQVRV